LCLRVVANIMINEAVLFLFFVLYFVVVEIRVARAGIFKRTTSFNNSH
jgi:hypothetical protein